jgi:hypothetical protein
MRFAAAYSGPRDVHDDGAQATDDVIVAVANVAPTADAGADQTASEGSVVTLVGAGADIAAADTLTYSWQLVSCANGQLLPGGTGTDYSFTPNDNGTYTFRLTVTDDDGGVGTDLVVVTVTNVAPTANAGADRTTLEGHGMMLAGSGTDAGSADTKTYTWQLLSSTNGQLLSGGSGQAYSFIPNDNGTYTFRLTVTDDDSGAGSGIFG